MTSNLNTCLPHDRADPVLGAARGTRGLPALPLCWSRQKYIHQSHGQPKSINQPLGQPALPLCWSRQKYICKSHGQPNPSINHSNSQLCLFVDLDRNISVNHMDSPNPSINHSDSHLCLFVDLDRNISVNHMDNQIHRSTTRTASSASLLI